MLTLTYLSICLVICFSSLSSIPVSMCLYRVFSLWQQSVRRKRQIQSLWKQCKTSHNMTMMLVYAERGKFFMHAWENMRKIYKKSGKSSFKKSFVWLKLILYFLLSVSAKIPGKKIIYNLRLRKSLNPAMSSPEWK